MEKKSTSDMNPQRPRYGVRVLKVILWTNYFNLYPSNDFELYRYSIDIAASGKERKPAKKAERIITLLVEEHFLPYKYNIATDFRLSLVSYDELDVKRKKNISLKCNLNLGDRNHALDPSKLGFVGHKKTLVVGIDVIHPSPGYFSSAPSVAGVVASVDEWLGQWPADIHIQPARQEW
ncbi:hypothetical protein F5Y09DRAFT_337693 [Xylaria sp. FL1042]|nr:hypothetical protein F5Y09DRAFT_337693 [Xylaria sp. FL1042]